MKSFEFHIDSHQAEWIFKPIRGKKDALILLMRVLKIMTIRIDPPAALRVGKIVLRIDRMSRLFFVSQSKIFSLNFPFIVGESEGALSFRSIHHPDVDSRVTSDILALLEAPQVLDSPDLLHFIDPVIDSCEIDSQIWGLFRELLMVEDGYLRYDYDPVHEAPHVHPLHHVDVFYSPGTTFKVGLDGPIDELLLSDILSVRTNCHYLRPAI